MSREEENPGISQQHHAAPLATLTLASSAITKPSSHKVAAVRNVPAMRSSNVLQPQYMAAALISSSSVKGCCTADLTPSTQQQQQQRRPSRQARFKPWGLPLAAAGALAVHLSRLVVSHVLRPGLTVDGRHPAAAPVADMRVFPSLLPKRGNGGGLARPAAPGGRKPALLWFRNDLRLHDHEPLAAANAAATSLLPVYIFDPREYGKSVNGFDKTGPYRARFILEALTDLRRRLRAAGSDLLVRLGKPEEILPQLAGVVGAGAVYCHSEVTTEEVGVEAAVASALDKAGAALKVLWGGTLFHVDDLPFKLPSMPPNYSDFRAKLVGLTVRHPAEAPPQLKGLPAASVECGDIPTLHQLGFDTATLSRCAADSSAAAAHLRGGETEALRRLTTYVSSFSAPGLSRSNSKQHQEQQQQQASNNSFCCKISPWLALGCLSSRQLYVELHKGQQQQQKQQHPPSGNDPVVPAPEVKAAGQEGDAGMQWLLFELLWRDFFRFVTMKYTQTGIAQKLKKGGGSPAHMPMTAVPA